MQIKEGRTILLKLTYLGHSGFLIEDEMFSMVIDYYSASSNDFSYDKISKAFKNKGKFYVLSSHSHPDHFDTEILRFKNIREDIIYIFSKDIEDLIYENFSDIIYLEKNNIFKDDLIDIKAFGSTDLGISFYIKTPKKSIFHAGDLNNWHWNEESMESEVKEAEDFYKRELCDIKKEVSNLDLAMFPIDPRLGEDYMKGAMEFIEKIDVKVLSPMHFQGDYEKAWAFFDFAKSKKCELIKWKDIGMSVEF